MSSENGLFFEALKLVFLALSGALLTIVFSQDLQVFPGAVTSIIKPCNGPPPVPDGVESYFLTTPDNRRINVWYLPGAELHDRINPAVPAKAAIVAHGNDCALGYHFAIQQWLRTIGIPSYGFDYRGFGASSGWPGEQGIYTDTETVYRSVIEREKLEPSQLMYVGESLGGSPVSWLATRHEPKVLLLLSTFSDMKAVLADRPFLQYFRTLLWYTFPTARYISNLKSACLVISHGGRDGVIDVRHARINHAAYHGSGRNILLINPLAGHWAFSASPEELNAAINSCDTTIKD